MGLLPIYFFIHYWIDKYLSKFRARVINIVLRMYKVPPRYEITLNERAMNILAVGILCHIAMNTWIFTNPEIFPDEIKTIFD